MNESLDERPHVDREQKVEDLIGVEERLHERVAFADQRAHVVGKQAMKPDVQEAQLAPAAGQLALPVGPQAERGVAATDRVLPHVEQRVSLGVERAREARHQGSRARRHRMR